MIAYVVQMFAQMLGPGARGSPIKQGSGAILFHDVDIFIDTRHRSIDTHSAGKLTTVTSSMFNINTAPLCSHGSPSIIAAHCTPSHPLCDMTSWGTCKRHEWRWRNVQVCRKEWKFPDSIVNSPSEYIPNYIWTIRSCFTFIKIHCRIRMAYKVLKSQLRITTKRKNTNLTNNRMTIKALVSIIVSDHASSHPRRWSIKGCE